MNTKILQINADNNVVINLNETYTFTIRATDAESQTTDRTFSLTSSFGATGGGQFN